MRRGCAGGRSRSGRRTGWGCGRRSAGPCPSGRGPETGRAPLGAPAVVAPVDKDILRLSEARLQPRRRQRLLVVLEARRVADVQEVDAWPRLRPESAWQGKWPRRWRGLPGALPSTRRRRRGDGGELDVAGQRSGGRGLPPGAGQPDLAVIAAGGQVCGRQGFPGAVFAGPADFDLLLIGEVADLQAEGEGLLDGAAFA